MNIIKPKLWSTGAIAVGVPVVFGMGILYGKLSQGPLLRSGIISAVSVLAYSAIDGLVKFLAEKFHLKLSTVKFIEACAGCLLATAFAVAMFALGAFGPISLGITLGAAAIFGAVQLGMGLYAKYGKKDIPYAQTAAFAERVPPCCYTEEQKRKMYWENLFYSLA